MTDFEKQLFNYYLLHQYKLDYVIFNKIKNKEVSLQYLWPVYKGGDYYMCELLVENTVYNHYSIDKKAFENFLILKRHKKLSKI